MIAATFTKFDPYFRHFVCLCVFLSIIWGERSLGDGYSYSFSNHKTNVENKGRAKEKKNEVRMKKIISARDR